MKKFPKLYDRILQYYTFVYQSTFCVDDADTIKNVADKIYRHNLKLLRTGAATENELITKFPLL